jgi:hypothetical protein
MFFQVLPIYFRSYFGSSIYCLWRKRWEVGNPDPGNMKRFHVQGIAEPATDDDSKDRDTAQISEQAGPAEAAVPQAAASVAVSEETAPAVAWYI